MSLKNQKLKIGISVGDPNGIGVEVILKTLQNKEILEFFTPVIFASTKLMSYQKNIFGLNSMYFQGIFRPEEAMHGKINVVNLWKENVSINFGSSTPESLQMAQSSFSAAQEALKAGHIDLLITAPTNEENTDEKENKKAIILFANNELRIAPIINDIPFSEASNKLNKDLIKKEITLLNNTLIQDFCIERPKIAVLALNSYDEKSGVLENEELEFIEPAIRESFNKGILAFGPYSPDSFFVPSIYSAFDGILVMHQDHSLIPLETATYNHSAVFYNNFPFIHMAPNHDTMYSIAGQGIAQEKSFEQAIFDGIKIYKTRRDYLSLKANALQKIKIEGIDSTLDEDLPEEEN